VTTVEMDAVANSVLLHRYAGRQTRARKRPAREVLLLRHPFVDTHAVVLRAQRFGAQSKDRPDSLINAQAEHLDRPHIVEPVDDQTRESIPLGVDCSVSIRLPLEFKNLCSQRDCVGNATAPEFRSGWRGLPRKEPETNLRTPIPKSVAELNSVPV